MDEARRAYQERIKEREERYDRLAAHRPPVRPMVRPEPKPEPQKWQGSGYKGTQGFGEEPDSGWLALLFFVVIFCLTMWGFWEWLL